MVGLSRWRGLDELRAEWRKLGYMKELRNEKTGRSTVRMVTAELTGRDR